MMGNAEVKAKLLKRYEDFEKIIAEKISERTSAMDPDYLAWAVLLLSDGLYIHQTIGNSMIDYDKFISQTALFVESLEDKKKK